MSNKLRIIVPTAVVSCAITAAIVWGIFSGGGSALETPDDSKKKAKKAIVQEGCEIMQLRMASTTGGRHTRPLLLSELTCPSSDYDSLRNSLVSYIEKKKTEGVLQTASVYFKELGTNKWFDINGTTKYNPGSLMKVAILMTYLKLSEKNPSLLEERYTLTEVMSERIDQLRTSAPLVKGQSYTVKFLLEEMIANSDNDATNMLNQHINQEMFSRVMRDLGCSTPDISDPNYQMTVNEYNRYLRVLYNASYLNDDNSEWALTLLTRSNYKGALMKGIPSGVEVAHKFGERPYENGFNFHEGGIVYLKNKPYILVVMTRGKDNTKLPGVIGEISKMCYDQVAI